MADSMDRRPRWRTQTLLADTATDVVTEINRLVQAYAEANTAMFAGTIRVVSDLAAGLSDSLVRGVSDVGDTLDRRRRHQPPNDRHERPARTPVTGIARTLSRAVNEEARVLQQASERFASRYDSGADREAARYDDMSMEELREEAREREVPGRNEMSRSELTRALIALDRHRDEEDGPLAEERYEDMTVSELRRLARERHLASEMNRADLIRALRESDGTREGRISGAQRSYEDMTVEELRELARERDISGRSEMNKTELIRALHASDREHTGG